ncbi:bacillithiol transferase BstA (plasmid) [Paenibacillus cellulosilyticus]|uniref:YfiT family bacillithiol transferase n=1 Tax=Paenibacillus cellulosilyticus TaxID=375489 RepID=UPI000D710E1E|nr:bacillithiol transferase BstA [Paenibacillus cellulosilyticus]QKS48849.1 bacillithiol transferase BstA [Paenibacillus cellulosilyticus]
MDDLRFPIGQFATVEPVDAEQRAHWMEEIERLPEQLCEAVAGLSDEQLDTPYRAGGWTVRQVVHHLADSHMNSYIRFKLAVTEELPTIKPYYEDRWAELSDGAHAPIELSLTLLKALHARWVYFIKSLRPEQFECAFIHPEHGRAMKLNDALGMYAWHGRHHVAHIMGLRSRNGW